MKKEEMENLLCFSWCGSSVWGCGAGIWETLNGAAANGGGWKKDWAGGTMGVGCSEGGGINGVGAPIDGGRALCGGSITGTFPVGLGKSPGDTELLGCKSCATSGGSGGIRGAAPS